MILFIASRQLFYVIESFRVIKIEKGRGMMYMRGVRCASIVLLFPPPEKSRHSISGINSGSNILINNFSLSAISNVSTNGRFYKYINKNASVSTESPGKNNSDHS